MSIKCDLLPVPRSPVSRYNKRIHSVTILGLCTLTYVRPTIRGNNHLLFLLPINIELQKYKGLLWFDCPKSEVVTKVTYSLVLYTGINDQWIALTRNLTDYPSVL